MAGGLVSLVSLVVAVNLNEDSLLLREVFGLDVFLQFCPFRLKQRCLLGQIRRKFYISLHTLPDGGRNISRNVAGKHYDSRHDKLKNSINTTEPTNTNIFKVY